MAAAMIRRGLSLLVVLATPGCFKAPMVSSQRSLATWHAMRDAQPSTARKPGEPAAADPGEALTAAQAYAMALAHNPALAVAEAEAAVAVAEIDAQKQLENPTLRLTNFQVDETVPGRAGFNLGLRAPIPRPGSIRARVAAARSAAEGMHSQAEAARRLLRTDIQRLFARLALLHADFEEVTRAAALADQRRQQLRARVEQAVATRVDLSIAEVEHAELIDEASRVRTEIGRTESELTLLVAPGTTQHYVIDRDELKVTDVVLDRDALMDRAIAARPDLRTGQTATNAARADVYLAKNEAIPWLSWAQVNYSIGASSTVSAFGFGLALDVPLFSFNLRKIKAANAVVRQRELEERAAVATVAGQVAAALARIEQADARLRDIEKNLLPQVEEAARQAEAALAAGSLDLVKALDLGDRQISARRLHLSALFERRDAVLELEAALGAP